MDFGKLRTYLFLGLLAVVTILLLFILRPFAYCIFWAAVLAALFHPVYKRINNFFKNNNLSATVTLLLVFVAIIIPFLIIGLLLVKESITLYTTVSDSNVLSTILSKITTTIKHNPLTNGLNIDESFWAQKFSEISKSLADFVFNSAKNITQNSVNFIIMFVLMLYSLFFFIRDGEHLLRKLMYLLPIGDRHEVMLYNKFVQAASSVIKGTIIIGGIQGSLGGITFGLAGIDNALIWGVIMVLFSIVPGVGSSVIWLPAGIIQILLGNVWSGILILVVGTVVISTIDNVLRPLLVGKDLEIPPLLILFSTLGGLFVFGASGFMIGPIVAALFLAFWEMYQQYFQKELQND